MSRHTSIWELSSYCTELYWTVKNSTVKTPMNRFSMIGFRWFAVLVQSISTSKANGRAVLWVYCTVFRPRETSYRSQGHFNSWALRTYGPMYPPPSRRTVPEEVTYSTKWWRNRRGYVDTDATYLLNVGDVPFLKKVGNNILFNYCEEIIEMWHSCPRFHFLKTSFLLKASFLFIKISFAADKKSVVWQQRRHSLLHDVPRLYPRSHT